MPFFFSERLPVPALKSYVTVSLLIFVTSLVYGRVGTYKRILSWEADTTVYDEFLAEPFCLWVSCMIDCTPICARVKISPHPGVECVHIVNYFLNKMFQAVVNMAYCGLFLCGKLIQQYVLGQLRHIEQQVNSLVSWVKPGVPWPWRARWVFSIDFPPWDTVLKLSPHAPRDLMGIVTSSYWSLSGLSSKINNFLTR